MLVPPPESSGRQELNFPPPPADRPAPGHAQFSTSSFAEDGGLVHVHHRVGYTGGYVQERLVERGTRTPCLHDLWGSPATYFAGRFQCPREVVGHAHLQLGACIVLQVLNQTLVRVPACACAAPFPTGDMFLV